MPRNAVALTCKFIHGLNIQVAHRVSTISMVKNLKFPHACSASRMHFVTILLSNGIQSRWPR